MYVVTDDLIRVNFSKDELPYQMIWDRIMATIYGNTRIFIYFGLYYSGCIISGRERKQVVSLLL
ncbi:MAG: hypothetical protein MUP69_07480 [Candidatus Atribacteria bacterium]|nr:hypothetical protein [Candidatus Atribacteria bacterium]